MGWSKRSSGHRYDSISGHAFLVSCICKKVIAAKVTSKKCSVCARLEKDEAFLKPHRCPLNHEGSSKAMESQAALEIVQEIYNENKGMVFVKSICSDDDSTLRAVLKHPRNNRKGRLPDHIPQPKFQADPTHRTKTVAAKIYALVNKSKKQSTCTNGDAR